MRKLTIIIAALGFLGATSLTPVAAATAGKDTVKHDVTTAKKVKNKKAEDHMKKSELSTDLSAAKKVKKEKKSDDTMKKPN